MKVGDCNMAESGQWCLPNQTGKIVDVHAKLNMPPSNIPVMVCTQGLLQDYANLKQQHGFDSQ